MSLRIPWILVGLLLLTACETDDPEVGRTAGSPEAATAAEASGDAPRERRDYPTLRSSVCDTLDNSFDCVRAIERQQLPRADGAWRGGDTLSLRVADEVARYVDERGDDPAEAVYYSYQARWPDRGHYLLQVQYYEGASFLLVDDRTGAETRLPDWPLLSPDGRRFAVLSLDLVAGYGPNALQVWRFGDGTPVLEWETRPSRWGPTEGRWISPDTLAFTRHGWCDELGGAGRGMCDRPARAVYAGGAWTLEPGLFEDAR